MLRNRRFASRFGQSGLWVLCILLAGCLGEPKLEDRWTRLDVSSSSLAPFQTLQVGSSQPITVRAAITYRSILTGFAVAELRASSTVTPASVQLEPTAPRELMAQDIERILASSVTAGRATRAVTGWNHLIQEIDFSFTGSVPAVVDSSGGPVGLFLICYLGSGQEVQLPNGADSLVVTPLSSSQYQILPVGMELGVQP